MFNLASHQGTIYSKYFNATPNWGDQVGVYLTQKITGRNVSRIRIGWREHLLTVGSILSECNSRSLVWGSGFISHNSKLKAMPRKITAVRGPKTLALLREHGFNKKIVLGDPAILMPRFYLPIIKKNYSMGYIPHYIDKDNPEVEAISRTGVKIIDIQLPVEEFVDALLECECIFSSSLHGLIAADSYGLPSKWVQGSKKIIGGDFKFQDYYESIGVFHEMPIQPQILISSTYDEKKMQCWKKENPLSLVDLINAFPLKKIL